MKKIFYWSAMILFTSLLFFQDGLAQQETTKYLPIKGSAETVKARNQVKLDKSSNLYKQKIQYPKAKQYSEQERSLLLESKKEEKVLLESNNDDYVFNKMIATINSENNEKKKIKEKPEQLRNNSSEELYKVAKKPMRMDLRKSMQ